MGDQVVVGTVDSLQDLPENTPGFLLRNVVVLQVLIQLSSLCEFHDDIDIRGGVEYFVEFDDVGVTQKLEDLDFPFDLDRRELTLEIMLLFFILALLRILTATLTPVREWMPSG